MAIALYYVHISMEVKPVLNISAKSDFIVQTFNFSITSKLDMHT